MPRSPSHAGIRRAVECYLAGFWHGLPIGRGDRCLRKLAGGSVMQLAVEADRVVIACHAPRTAGARVALALADEVAALFRGRTFGRFRFDTASIDLDGRDPDSFRAVVTLPIRQDAGCPSRPAADAPCTPGR